MSDDRRPPDLAAVGELGLRAASAIVEQMLRLGQQVGGARFPVTLFGSPSDDDTETRADAAAGGTGGGRPDIRTLRADADRLIELYGEWTRTLLDGLTDLATVDGDGADPLELVVAPGATATATAYLHLLEGPLASAGRFHLTTLTAHHGGSIPASAGSVDPPGASGGPVDEPLALTLAVTVPDRCRPGRYVGHVLLEGVPEVALPVVVEVVEP